MARTSKGKSIVGYTPKSISDAEKLEEKADSLRKLRRTNGTLGLEISKLYEDAGDLRKTLDIRGADEAYRNAQIYGDAADTVRLNLLERKRASLYSERKKRIENGYIKSSPLSRRLMGIFSIASFLAALFFLSFNFTGAAIGSVSSGGSLWIGLVLALAGIGLAMVYFRENESSEERRKSKR